jgi:hypothetical protein
LDHFTAREKKIPKFEETEHHWTVEKITGTGPSPGGMTSAGDVPSGTCHNASHSRIPVKPFSGLVEELVQIGAVSHVPGGQHAFLQEESEHVVAAANTKI